MQHNWNPTRRFLLAAKQAELAALEQLAINCQVVAAVRSVIHQLQRERGCSNIFLCSKGIRFSEQRQAAMTSCIACEQTLQQVLSNRFLAEPVYPGNMRLLSSIARALQQLDQLPLLRDSIGAFQISATDATESYCELISALLAVIFEAADIANDPVITRVLVALFNFLQGKEFSGQERAKGAIGFADKCFDPDLTDQLLQLQRAQDHSFDVFIRFCEPQVLEHWQTLTVSAACTDLEKLRRVIGQLAEGAKVPDELSEIWYDVCTQRIDAMQGIEEEIATELLALAMERVTQTKQDLRGKQELILKLPPVNSSPLTAVPAMGHSFMEDSSEPKPALNGHLAFYDLLCEQARHIDQMSIALDEARQAITDQKLIDRAKLILMQQLNLSEAQAFRRLQKHAMDQNQRMVEVASRVVAAANS